MKLVVSCLGAVLVMAALRDVFHTLWHPTRRGGASRLIMAGAWRLAHLYPARQGLAQLVGPLAMVLVVALWASAIVVGWAVVYLPHMPEGFTFGAGLRPEEHTNLLDSVYLSVVTVTTLGFGDIAPQADWLRVAAPLEAMVGFALLTASVSWVLQIYPALVRRRSLALRLSMLRRSQPAPHELTAAVSSTLLDAVAAEVARVRVDFTQYAEAYYFFDGEQDVSLAVMIDYAADLADQGRAAPGADTRWSAASLALDDLAGVLDRQFLHTGGDTAQIFAAYARDHRGPEPTSRSTGPKSGR
ncbi:potassium channel family protein [Yinghuangia sp. YIM S10712]|uniref:potassium channel family protein n=1 Tax=Yinghuangia sp. YIM S10712 TaxID=3436930 RepID=UPI003F53D835